MPPPALPTNTSVAQTGLIFRLPAEMFLAICDFSTLSDHDKLSRTCRTLTAALQRYLFRRSSNDHFGAIRYGCKTGNVQIIRRSLEFGFPPTVDDIIDHKPVGRLRWDPCHCFAGPDSSGRHMMSLSALGAAIDGSNAPAVDYLMSRGASRVHGPSCTVSPLLFAIRPGCEEVVLVMLKRGATPNVVETKNDHSPYSHHRTALVEAVRELQNASRRRDRSGAIDRHSDPDPRIKILNHLFDFAADPNLADGCSYTPLKMALIGIGTRTRTSIRIIKTLLNRGADPNYSEPFARHSIFFLVAGGYWGIDDLPQEVRQYLVDMMIRAGADVNAKDPYNDSWTFFTLTFLFRCSLHDQTHDYGLLAELYEKKTAQMQHMRICPGDRVSLCDVLDDEKEWKSGMFPILLKAGAQISRSDLSLIEECVKAQSWRGSTGSLEGRGPRRDILLQLIALLESVADEGMA